MKRLHLTSALLLTLACTPDPAAPDVLPPPRAELETREGYPTLVEPCMAPSDAPTQLLVTTTDFSTGAVSLLDLATHEVAADLALASTDAVPLAWGERAFVLNRFGYDWIDELDPHDSLALVHEFAIVPSELEVSANPQSLVFDASERAWISLYGAPELQVHRVPSGGGEARAELAFDLSRFADADGIPELGTLIACGEQLFAVAERIDREAWVPSDATWLIPLTTTAGSEALHEFDAGHAGPDALVLRGTGFGAWRLDPADPSGHTVLVLNSGIERIDLAAGTSEWVVDESVFDELGFTHLHLAGFDLDAQGRMWLAAATSNYAEYRLYRVELADEPASAQLVERVAGLHSITGDLEIVGERLYFADTTLGDSGVRVFELDAAGQASETPDSPLAVGLPPMGLAGLTSP